MSNKTIIILFLYCLVAYAAKGNPSGWGTVSGKVVSADGEVVDYALVSVKGGSNATSTDENGLYTLQLPTGRHTLLCSAVGYYNREIAITVKADEKKHLDIILKPTATLAEVTVKATNTATVKRSAFAAADINTAEMRNSSRTVGDALAKSVGVKIRETGGAGSDMSVSLDGFTGKHVKVFVDGVVQNSSDGSFGLANLPVNMAERIEVYRGVVPVKFGADAIGGVINIVTPQRRKGWQLDAAYSFGSFNTHRSHINFARQFGNGFKLELNGYQNYSDNDYWVDAPVEDFKTGSLNRRKPEHVQRFNDGYSNEAVMVKAGFAGKRWADRLMIGVNASQTSKEIQTGVRQEIVYGNKHRRSKSFIPSVEYAKRNFVVKRLDVNANASYSISHVTNVDTSSVKYNWRGETAPLNSPGEQSLLHSRAANRNLNASGTATYRLASAHTITANNQFTRFTRRNSSLLANSPASDEFGKRTSKNIAGLSYRFAPSAAFNVTAFGKYYHQHVAGPVATSATLDNYREASHSVGTGGYGVAATYLFPLGVQLKLSGESACRLPTVEEMFGNEDLELGDMTLRPEKSMNLNMGASWSASFGAHNVTVDAGAVYRNMRDYIQRNIMALSGGKSAATYVNYGKVKTIGLNLSARYSYSNWLSAGMNFTQMNVRDNMPTAKGSSRPNLSYGERMPNVPYMFADSEVALHWPGLGGRGNRLTFGYDNRYTHSFSYYMANIGSANSDYMVPTQMAHNISIAYSLMNGRYNISLECHNLTDARLYDNFSLQKPGRAFYGKFRIFFENRNR